MLELEFGTMKYYMQFLNQIPLQKRYDRVFCLLVEPTKNLGHVRDCQYYDQYQLTTHLYIVQFLDRLHTADAGCYSNLVLLWPMLLFPETY